jgi:hypothetical protein
MPMTVAMGVLISCEMLVTNSVLRSRPSVDGKERTEMGLT